MRSKAAADTCSSGIKDWTGCVGRSYSASRSMYMTGFLVVKESCHSRKKEIYQRRCDVLIVGVLIESDVVVKVGLSRG